MATALSAGNIDDDWSQWQDPEDYDAYEGALLQSSPPPLPSPTKLLHRVSSCYLDAASHNSLLDLALAHSRQELPDTTEVCLWNYHDILLHTLSFLDTPSLQAWSETSRRGNDECFYFLQSQLQQAYDSVDSASLSVTDSRLHWVQRLARRSHAQDLLDSYLQSRHATSHNYYNHYYHYLRKTMVEGRECMDTSTAAGMATATTTSIVMLTLLASSSSAEYAHLIRGGVMGIGLMGAKATVPMKTVKEGVHAVTHKIRQRLGQQENADDDDQHDSQEAIRPSGCVGAYQQVIHRARQRLREHVKEERRHAYQQRSDAPAVQERILNACARDDTSNLNLHAYDVDAFGVGPDGTRTCALHAAAFNNAPKAIHALCAGIGNDEKGTDGGLADVNVRDDNGWTALHFAAGANYVDAIRALLEHHADTEVEAANGYTPLQWAERLQNDEAAAALREGAGPARPLFRFLSSFMSTPSSS